MTPHLVDLHLCSFPWNAALNSLTVSDKNKASIHRCPSNWIMLLPLLVKRYVVTSRCLVATLPVWKRGVCGAEVCAVGIYEMSYCRRLAEHEERSRGSADSGIKLQICWAAVSLCTMWAWSDSLSGVESYSAVTSR